MRIQSKHSGQVLDEICLRDLTVQCNIGINPDEKYRTQTLLLNLTLYIDTRKAAHSGQLSESIDYAALSCDIQFILTYSRFRLLESAAEALASYILTASSIDKPRAICEAVAIEIIKPEALRGISIPAVRIFRVNDASTASTSLTNWETLFISPEASLFRGIVPPQSHLPLTVSFGQIQAIMTESSWLTIGSKQLLKSQPFVLNDGLHKYLANKCENHCSFLAIVKRDQQKCVEARNRNQSSFL